MDLKGIQIEKRYTEGLPPVNVDTTLMTQVFFNLIKNAREAMEGGGTLTIMTGLSEEGYIEINFTDTGPGIEKENLSHIFSPFFTTKRDKGGTGLGLSVVSNIVSRRKGRIWATSEVGKGTTFTIRLPVACELQG